MQVNCLESSEYHDANDTDFVNYFTWLFPNWLFWDGSYFNFNILQ